MEFLLTSMQDMLHSAMANAREDGQDLISLLYGPLLPHKWDRDGTLMLRAPTRRECEAKLEFALKLFHSAREHAIHGAPTARETPSNPERRCYRPLNSPEMTRALDRLKEIFRHEYLTRPGLGQIGRAHV